MPLASGTRLGPYEILSAIGAGGMGEVYKARDTRLGRTVAIKVLPAGATADPERLRRFEQEARAVSTLNHPHICVLHDIGREAGVDYLVMEHLDGQTLAHRLRKGPLPLTQVLELGAQIADALAAAHRAGIVHRDLKPANVMLTKSGAKLLDFGLAKLKPQPAGVDTGLSALSTQAPATMSGAVMGTVPYMAPEQLEGKETDARTDLFAFGCVVYEMLTARRAFSGDSEASVVSAIMSGEPTPLSTLQPLTPPALDRLVRRCLAKDPDDRWQHAADVAEELRGISQDAVATDGARAVRHRKWPPGIFAAVAVMAVLVIAALAWIITASVWPHSEGPARFALAMPAGTELISDAYPVMAAANDSGVVYRGRDGRARLYWHELRGLESWPLAGTEDAHTPVLSPDSRWLAFFRSRKLFKLPMTAGRVVEGSYPVEVATFASNERGAAWGSDNTIIVGTANGGLWSVSLENGAVRQLTSPDRSQGELDHRWPSFLPGGQHVLFTIAHVSLRVERSRLAVLSLTDGRVTKILQGGSYARYLPSGHLVFAARGSLLAIPFDLKTLKATGSPLPVLADIHVRAESWTAAYDVTTDGALVYAPWKEEPPSNALVWVTRDGALEPAVPDRQAYVDGWASLSPDGRRVAVGSAGSQYTNIWTYDIHDRRWQQIRADADCRWPVWSRSGDRLVFSSNRDGPWELYVVASDGEGPWTRLTRSGGLKFASSWSPDGRFVTYADQSNGRWVGFSVEVDGRSAPQSLPGDALVATFSPDGRWATYSSYTGGVWARSFPEWGPKQPVSGSSGGFDPVWSADGREIFYVEHLPDARIMSRQVESLAPLRLGPPRVAFALPFAPGSGRYWQPRSFSLTPDGRRVLVIQADERAPVLRTLFVVRNWSDEVEAKMAAAKR
jgi:eukaryotic-like serine/threonine-protein kinase